MKKILLTVLFLGSSILFADTARKCTEKEITQFDAFLKANKADFDKIVAEDEGKTPNSDIYKTLSDVVQTIMDDKKIKAQKCEIAVLFCKEDVSEEWRMVIETPPAMGLLDITFGINRDECEKFFVEETTDPSVKSR